MSLAHSAYKGRGSGLSFNTSLVYAAGAVVAELIGSHTTALAASYPKVSRLLHLE